MMISKVLQKVEEGLNLGNFSVHAKNVRSWGMNGVVRMEIIIKENNKEEPLFCLAFFPGRKMHYRPWIEIFCIKNTLESGTCYYDSPIEDTLLEFFSGALGPGGKIYIEYLCDRETAFGLALGYPPAATRQGYRLFIHGFTWFKDYYYSEGGHEGGQKLEGEKPLNKMAREKHVNNIKLDLETFLEVSSCWKTEGEAHEYVLRARERAMKVIDLIAAGEKEYT